MGPCILLGQLIKADTLNTPQALHTIQSGWRKCLGLSIGRIFPVLETLSTAHTSLSERRIGCLLTCVYTWDRESFSADLLSACWMSESHGKFCPLVWLIFSAPQECICHFSVHAMTLCYFNINKNYMDKHKMYKIQTYFNDNKIHLTSRVQRY